MTLVSAPPPREPEVSIIIPVYNTEAYLSHCVESVQTQTGVDLEIICIDDGSTDSSAGILRELAAGDDRIQVIRQPNGGLSRARNAGLGHASGRYVCFLDSDDYWTSDRLAPLVARARNDALDVLMFDALPLREHGTEDRAWRKYQKYYTRSGSFDEVTSGPELVAQMLESGDYLPSACLYLVRRELLISNQLRFYPGISREDNLFTFAVMLNAERAGHSPSELYLRRVRPGSIMTAGAEAAAMQGYFVTFLGMMRMLAVQELPPHVADQLGRLAATMYRFTREGFVAASPEERRRLSELDRRPDARAVLAMLRSASRDARATEQLRAKNKALENQLKTLRGQPATPQRAWWRSVARSGLSPKLRTTLKQLRGTARGDGPPAFRTTTQVKNRLHAVAALEAQVFDPNVPTEAKSAHLKTLHGHGAALKELLTTASPASREQVRQAILEADLQLINTSFLAEARGIAFCQNFSPFRDASAYAAAKRLPQIEAIEGRKIAWRVISANLGHYHGVDPTFRQFYVRYRRAQQTQIPGMAYFNERSQHRWASRAVTAADGRSVPIIYSRSMWPGSHEAAYRYKRDHPDSTWYAEFSDPVYLDITGNPRPATQVYRGDEEWLNDYWRNVEEWVYEGADHIIFTNQNQREVMLGSADSAVAHRAASKGMVLNHPILDARWANVLAPDYPVDPDLINVGYFGRFYSTRSADALLPIADDPRIRLHLFVPTVSDVRSPMPERIRVNPAVDHLRMLSIGRSMDYLLLNDVRYTGPLNPYLPSKLADYLSTGTPVIALTTEGSALQTVEHPALRLVSELTREVVSGLAKQA